MLRIFISFVAILIVLIIAWSVIMKKGNENHAAIEEEKKQFMNRIVLPPQAQVFPGDLVKIVDKDMSDNNPILYTFYYKMEAHTMGIGLYNKKYVFMVDDQVFATYPEVMGKATVHNSRFAGISEKFTITHGVSQTTNKRLKVEEIPALQPFLVEDTSTHYNEQVEFNVGDKERM